ncbi:MAG TPA: DUF4296 domain-containing protein [Ferruginibacter sp.]|nr:DUF4296 domain-containing protein [Ferruginibacter sp.]
MRKIIAIVLIGFCLTSCKDKNALPAGILNKDKMQAILWDVIRAESFTTNFVKRDSTKNLVLEDAKLQHQIFAMHNVTKDVFYTSYNYYRMHPELMAVVLDSIDAVNNRVGNPQIKNGQQPPPFPGRHFPDPHGFLHRDSLNKLNPLLIKKK